MRYKTFYKREGKIGRRGVVLVLTFMIMATVLIVAMAFLFMLNTRSRGTVFDVASHKALWVAEAGLQDVIYRLRTDIAYRNDPTQVNGSIGDGGYSVTVSRDGSTYTLSSTGTVDVIERELSQSVIVTSAFPDAFGYAVFGNTNANPLTLENNVAVSGDLFYDGDVAVEGSASVTNGLVYADSVSGDGTYAEAPGPPDPVPAYPAFDTTYYDEQITTAEGEAASDWTLDGSDSYDLSGGTVYYDKVTIKNNATVMGPGTIVATDNVKIDNNANISSNITIISKTKIEVKADAVVEGGAVLYGRNEIKLKDQADVTGSLLVPTSGKKVKMEDSSSLTGIIYADKIEFKVGNASDAIDINGSVVADSYKSDEIKPKKGDLNITFDQSSFPNSVPTGLEGGEVTVVPQRDWNEN